jgi:hypothetical protein
MFIDKPPGPVLVMDVTLARFATGPAKITLKDGLPDSTENAPVGYETNPLNVADPTVLMLGCPNPTEFPIVNGFKN